MTDEKPDVTYLSMKAGRIGINGLQALLKEACVRSFSNDKELSTFLLQGIKERNYIPPSCEKEYLEKLLKEYKRFTGSLDEVDESEDILEIKILGIGCSSCQKMVQETMAALSEMELPADFEYVGEPNRIREYNVTGTPAVIINRKVKSVGRVLTKEEIKRLLNEELKKRD